MTARTVTNTLAFRQPFMSYSIDQYRGENNSRSHTRRNRPSLQSGEIEIAQQDGSRQRQAWIGGAQRLGQHTEFNCYSCSKSFREPSCRGFRRAWFNDLEGRPIDILA